MKTQLFFYQRKNVILITISITLFTGKERDKSTNLDYFGARYYDSELRHFIQADSLIPNLYEPQSLNKYSYALNNPYTYVDPDGKWAVQANFGLGISVPGTGGSGSISPVISYSGTYGFQATFVGSLGAGLSIGAIGKGFIEAEITPEAQQVSDVAGHLRQQGIAVAYGHGGGISYSEGENGLETYGISYNPGLGAEYHEYGVDTKMLPWKIHIGGKKKEESSTKISEDDKIKLSGGELPLRDELSYNFYSKTEDPGPDGVIYAYEGRKISSQSQDDNKYKNSLNT